MAMVEISKQGSSTVSTVAPTFAVLAAPGSTVFSTSAAPGLTPVATSVFTDRAVVGSASSPP